MTDAVTAAAPALDQPEQGTPPRAGAYATTARRIARGALAGLVAGATASFAMDRLQAGLSSLSGAGSGSGGDSDDQPATSKAADRVAVAATGHSIAAPAKPLAGQWVHYTVGTMLGLGYGLAAEFAPRITSFQGSALGLGTAVLLDEGAVPALGLGQPPWRAPASSHLYSLASHMMFGVVAELVRSRVDSTLAPADT